MAVFQRRLEGGVIRVQGYAALLLIAAAVSAGDSARASVTDTGDVALSGNDLVIGNVADGSRTVDTDADGPYDSATLGVSQGVTGSLTLDTNATFTTTGTFTAGNQGSAVVQLNNGSTLGSGNVALGTSTFTLSGGSSWINDGAMTYSTTYGDPAYRDGPNIVVTGGAGVVTNGVLVSGYNSGADGLDLRVDGLGASWWNNGQLQLAGSSLFSVLNGATARDGGVWFRSNAYDARAIVDGVGSTWETGRITFPGFFYTNGGPQLAITNGARVDSSSAYLGDLDAFLSVLVDGAGSSWSIAGKLETRADGLGIRVTRGATLETGDANFFTSSSTAHGVEITGPGSLWDLQGNLQVFSLRSDFEIGQGGSFLVRGDSHLSTLQVDCPFCSQRISVHDEGSFFRTEGSLTLQGWRSTDPSGPDSPAQLAVADSGRAEVGNGITALDGGEIQLRGGSIAAPLVALQGGRLSGEGSVEGDVVNHGRVEPGVGSGPLRVEGAFTQASNGAFAIVLGGTKAGTEHSLLEVLRTATLGGALEVTIAQGYAPAVGDVYEVLRADSLSGAFESYAGLDVGGGVTLVPEYGPTALLLRAVPEPTTGSLIGLGLLIVAGRARISRASAPSRAPCSSGSRRARPRRAP